MRTHFIRNSTANVLNCLCLDNIEIKECQYGRYCTRIDGCSKQTNDLVTYRDKETLISSLTT